MKHTFGCASTETGEFYNQEADGIIGFGSNSYDATKNDPPNILQTERLEGRIKSLVFSICLGHNGGEMTFGDWNKYLHLDRDSKLRNEDSNPNRVKAADVKLHEDHRFILTNAFEEEDPWQFQYRVPLEGIDFDGERIEYPYAKMNRGELNGEGAFFDTGTTYMYTSHAMFRKMKKHFDKYCNRDITNCGGENRWEECYSIEDEQKDDLDGYFRSFPMLTFHFAGNRPYRWYPSDYLIKNGDLDQYCVGIKPLKDMILGAVFMRNYDILFDKTRRLIGFARSDCNSTGNVHYYDDNGDDILKKVPVVRSRHEANPAVAGQSHASHKHKRRHKGRHSKEARGEEGDDLTLTLGLMILAGVLVFLVGVLLRAFVFKAKKHDKPKDDDTVIVSANENLAKASVDDRKSKQDGVSQKGKLQ